MPKAAPPRAASLPDLGTVRFPPELKERRRQKARRMERLRAACNKEQLRNACSVLNLPSGAPDTDVVYALAIMDYQMNWFAEGKLAARSQKAEQKWLSDLLTVHVARPKWVNVYAPALDKAVQAIKRDLKRHPPSGQKRLRATAERKGLAANMAYGLMNQYGFKLTGHREGKFVRLAGILYNGDPHPEKPPCYVYCCALLQKKKAYAKKKAAPVRGRLK
jgi:hypothetical protein